MYNLPNSNYCLSSVVSSSQKKNSHDTNLHLQIFLFFYSFTTSIQNWTDKSMKMDLIYRNKVLEVEGLDRHAVLVL